MKRKFFTKKLLALMLMFAMVFSSLPVNAWAAEGDSTPQDNAVTVNVDFTAQAENTFLIAPQHGVAVSSNLAESYGYVDSVTDGVSALDVLVKIHEVMFEDAFTSDTKDDILVVSDKGFVTTIFGEETANSSFAINGACPNDGVFNETYGAYNGYSVNQAPVNNGDTVEFFLYQDDTYLDNYVWFTQNGAKIDTLAVDAGAAATLNLEGYSYMLYGLYKEETIAEETQPIEYAQLAWVDAVTGSITDIAGAATDENGAVTITAPAEAGVHYLTAYITAEDIADGVTPIFMPLLKVDVKPLPDTAITVPADAEIFVGSKTKHFVVFTEQESVKVKENADGTKTYYFDLGNGTYNYRVSGEQYVTYAGTFKKTNAAYELNVGAEQLKPADKTRNTVDHDVTSNGGYNVADIYLNINPQGYLKLDGAGDKHQIVNLRNWEAVDTTVNNYFIEPDYHYTVIDEDGAASDVVTVDENGLLVANKAGTAIVLVTYDAMNVNPAAGGPFFGAIWPENTGVFVVSVGAGNSGIDTGMTLNEGKNATTAKIAGDALDAEHDVIYFIGDEGSYTFKPKTAGCTVSVANSQVGSKMTFDGFEAVNKNSDGSYDVPLTQGRNIVKVEKGGKAEYQVITAKQVNVQVNGVDIDKCQPLNPGDEVSVTFDTLYHPANKLAGVYNMSALAVYTDVDGYAGKLVGSASNQYQFASKATAQTVASTVTRNATAWSVSYKADATKLIIPADYAEDTFTLAGGSLIAIGFGDPYGNHRRITLENGKDPNFNAQTREAYLGQLPNIEISVAPKAVESIEITTPPAKLDYYEGDNFDSAGMVVQAAYSDGTPSAAVTSYTISPKVIAADTKEVTVSYGGKTAVVKVNVTPLIAESIQITTPPVKTAYKAGEVFDPTGMVVTATYNSGKTAEVKDYKYAPARELQETDTAMTITYGGENGAAALTATTPITVNAASSGGSGSKNITVKFTLLGDSYHDSETDGKVHTLKAGNLTEWIKETEITVPGGSNVLDVIAKALGLAGIPYENADGNYISEVRGLGEFDNGTNSGWQYTLNGKHPNLGVNEQAVKAGDRVVFHYTDDWTLEDWSNNSGGGSGGGGTTVDKPADDNNVQPADGNGFTDTKNHWAADAIDFVVKENLFTGTTAATFEPETAMNRAMLVTVLWRLDGKPSATGSNFADLVDGAYYESAVAWAAANGIVKGYSDTQFAPNDKVTREQMAAIFCRYAEHKGYDVSGKADLSGFADNSQISSYAVDNIKWAKAVGLMNGRTETTLAPQGDSTRAEVATMIQRFVNNVKK